jgi:hypothetical protein
MEKKKENLKGGNGYVQILAHGTFLLFERSCKTIPC